MDENIIGRKIRMAMHWRNYACPELALENDIDVGELYDIVNGTETPDSTTLIAISKALGVSIDWLMTSLEQTDELMQDGLKYHRMKGVRGEPPAPYGTKE